MWNIFKKQHKSYESNDLSAYDRIINYIQTRGLNQYYKLQYFDLPFCYFYYYEKTNLNKYPQENLHNNYYIV